MLHKINLVRCLFVLALFNTNSYANETDKTNDIFNLEVFSVSKKKESAFDSASSVYVLTTEDIRRSGATSIPEALRLVPGLQVARIDGSKWAISSRGFNRQFSNKLLVMIDGRVVYTALFAGVPWDIQDYVLEDIDKIEVVRGPGGTIWGTNAVNGIINIITKNSNNTQGAYASAIIGNQDKSLEARYGGRTKKNNHYRIYAKQSNHGDFDKLDKTNGTHFSNDDGYRQVQGGFRYDIRSIKNNNISFNGSIRQGKSQNYFDYKTISQTADGLGHRKTQGANLVASWDKTFSKKSSMSLNSYIDYDRFDINVLQMELKTIDVDFQHFYDFNRENQFIWGLGYRWLVDSIKERPLNSNLIPLDYTPNSRNDAIISAFIQDKIGLIPDFLYLTLGSKFEHNDFTGNEIQPNAKLTLFPSDNQTVWASISRAVRAPTRGEDGLNLFNGSQKGNSNFDSEKSIAYELGYRIKPSRSLLFDVSSFYTRYDDLRTFEGATASKTVANLGRGSSYGGEFSAKWQATNDWLLEAGYDFLRLNITAKPGSTDLQSMIDTAGESPQNQFRLRSNYNLTKNIEFDNIVYYVDSLPDSRKTTGPGLIDQNGVPAYVRFDTRIGYLPNENLELSLVGQNLTDHRHQEFSNALAGNKTEVGRSFYFKLVWQY